METTTTTLATFERYQLTAVDMANIQKRVQQAQLMKNVPVMMRRTAQVVLASKVLLETKAIIDEVNELRKERGYAVLADDKDFMGAWDGIEAAGKVNDALLTLRLTLKENVRLTHEVNAHRAALGRALMKTYK